MKKRIVAILLSALLLMNISGCNVDSQNDTDKFPENDDTTNSNSEENDKVPNNEENTGTVDIEGEYDPVTNMRYTLNADGNSYTVCPAGLPDVIKELVIPGEYKGLPVTKIYGKFLADSSIETIIISEGIKEILIGFDYCRDIKNIYIPASVSYISEGAFNCRPTMGAHGHMKSNVIEKIVVAEGNPYYYVDGNCLIDRRLQKIILGCNSSVIPNDGSVKSIGRAAFANCHAIETIILPKSIIDLENYAFCNCDNLKKVYITSSVSEDKEIVNFDAEFVFEGVAVIIYLPDAESLTMYSKVYGPYLNFETGIGIENENSNDIDIEESTLVEMYKEILYDFMNGINPFETVDWILNVNPSLSFAIVDMCGDDSPELIIYNLDNYGEHLVLHYVSEKSYFITPQFGFRGMYNIMKDGTFAWNRSAGTEYGAAKLKFDGSSVDYIELYMIRNDGTDEVEFFIGNLEVTEEELDVFYSLFSNERAEFYELTEENIEKYVTLETFNHN